MTTWRAGITDRVPAGDLGVDVGIAAVIALLTLVIVVRGACGRPSGRRSWPQILTLMAATICLAGMVAFFPLAVADHHHGGGAWNSLFLVPLGAIIVGAALTAEEAPRAYGSASSIRPYLFVDLAATALVAFGVFWIAAVLLYDLRWGSPAQLLLSAFLFVATLLLGAGLSALRAVRREQERHLA